LIPLILSGSSSQAKSFHDAGLEKNPGFPASDAKKGDFLPAGEKAGFGFDFSLWFAIKWGHGYRIARRHVRPKRVAEG